MFDLENRCMRTGVQCVALFFVDGDVCLYKGEGGNEKRSTVEKIVKRDKKRKREKSHNMRKWYQNTLHTRKTQKYKCVGR